MVDGAPLRLIDLCGSAHERGRQHGTAAPQCLGRFVEMYAQRQAAE
jgi:hypothetical protein